MECSHVTDKLYEYIYDELDDIQKVRIEEHLKNCTSCSGSYLKLKKLLVDDAEGLIKLRDNIAPPCDLNSRIEAMIKPKAHMKYVKYIAAACILLMLTFSTPVLAYYVMQMPPIDKYVDLDNSIIVDFDEGRGQLVQKSCTMNNITFTVDGIIRKKDTTSILFTIKVPKDKNINYGIPEDSFDVVTVTDQFGTRYRSTGSSLTVKSVNEDGEAKCIYDITPLKFWSYKLHIRMTAIELGYYEENKTIDKVKNVYGNWNVSFYINRSNSWR